MLKTITAWAMLASSSFLAPASLTAVIEDQKPSTEITYNRAELPKTDFNPNPSVSVSETVDLHFDRVGVTSLPAPEPEPEPEPTPPPAKENNTPSQPANNTPVPVAAPFNQPAVPTPSPISVAPGSAKEEAKRQLAGYGWGDDQFSCLVSLWEKESNWNHTAANPSSGAYGIPQSLPGNKMASAGADWQTNPATQIKWGLGYIKDRYQTPCGAWNHSIAVGWY